MRRWPISIALLIWKFDSCFVLFLSLSNLQITLTLYLSLNFCTIQYLVQHKINILRAWAADARLTRAFAMASVTGTNYCPDA